MKRVIGTVLFVSLIALSCNKHDYVFPVQWINTDLKHKFSFHAGSYWVYKDLVTGLTDTAISSAPDVYIDPGDEENRHEHMTVGIGLFGKNAGAPDDTSVISYYFEGTSFLRCLYGFRSSGATCFYSVLPFTKPGKAASDSTTIDQIYPTYTLNAIEYHNVARIVNKSYGNGGYGIFYFNDSVGMIKMEISIGTFHKDLELQSYHIIKD